MDNFQVNEPTQKATDYYDSLTPLQRNAYFQTAHNLRDTQLPLKDCLYHDIRRIAINAAYSNYIKQPQRAHSEHYNPDVMDWIADASEKGIQDLRRSIAVYQFVQTIQYCELKRDGNIYGGGWKWEKLYRKDVSREFKIQRPRASEPNAWLIKVTYLKQHQYCLELSEPLGNLQLTDKQTKMILNQVTQAVIAYRNQTNSVVKDSLITQITR